jgi:hypothetical protein
MSSGGTAREESRSFASSGLTVAAPINVRASPAAIGRRIGPILCGSPRKLTANPVAALRIDVVRYESGGWNVGDKQGLRLLLTIPMI